MDRHKKKKGIQRKHFIAGILALAVIVVAAEVLLLTGVFGKKDKKKNTNNVTPTEAAGQPTEKIEVTQAPPANPDLVTVYRETVRYFMHNAESYPGVEMKYNEQGQMTEYFEMDYTESVYIHHLYEYDSEDRLVKTEKYEKNGKLAETVTRTYDEAGNIREILYQPGPGRLISPERTSYEYDEKGRKVKESMHALEPEVFEYEIDYVYNDADLQTDYYWHGAYGDSVEHYHYDFDSAGREIRSSKEQEDGTFITITEKEYDGKGNVIRDVLYNEQGLWVASRLYSYDERGLLLEKRDLSTEEGNPDQFYSKTVCLYDEKGRKTRETMYYTDDVTLSDEGFVYDENGCLKEKVYYNEDGTVSGSVKYEYMAFSIPYDKLTEDDLEWYNRENRQ